MRQRVLGNKHKNLRGEHTDKFMLASILVQQTNKS